MTEIPKGSGVHYNTFGLMEELQAWCETHKDDIVIFSIETMLYGYMGNYRVWFRITNPDFIFDVGGWRSK